MDSTKKTKRKSRKNRRKFERFDTSLKIKFAVDFAPKTKIDFRVKEKQDPSFSQRRYSAVGKNISAQGLCFSARHMVAMGDVVLMDIYVPSAKKAITMLGEVKWCQCLSRPSVKQKQYIAGVLLISVNGQEIKPMVFEEKGQRVIWSEVLDAVFGSFKNIVNERKSSSGQEQSS